MQGDKTQEEASETVRAFLRRLVDFVRPAFPAYASAISIEITGTRLTTDRWNRITHVLASMESMPGRTFCEYEHDVRNLATAAVVPAQCMAIASFGMRDPPGRRRLALSCINDLDNRIARIQQQLEGTKIE